MIHSWRLKLPSFLRKKNKSKLSEKTSNDSFNTHYLQDRDMVTLKGGAIKHEMESPSSENYMVKISCGEEDILEMARQSLASRRLSFEQDDSCSVLSMAAGNYFPFKDAVVLPMETENPYMDFLVSMEQMSKAYGLKPGGKIDWEFLEDLLTWFLRINNMKNQDFIIAAFVDLCLLLSSSS